MTGEEISIIVPVYNVECYLEKCINSILAQTFSEFELILVDDGSTDRSGDICDSYAEIDSRIKVVHQDNKGVSSARNAGLLIAEGEYIGFVDSDDYIDSNMFEILYAQAVKSSSDIVLCDFHILNESEEILNKDNKKNINHEVIEYRNTQALEQMFIQDENVNFGTNLNPKWIVLWNKLYKKNLFVDFRFSNGVIYQGYEDERTAHQFLFKSKKVTYVRKSLYYYFARKKSLSNFSFNINKFERVYALKSRADFFKNKNLNNLHYKALKNYMDAFFWNYFMAKSTLFNVNKELKQLKRTMNKSLMSFIKNPLIGWRQKIFIALFIINPHILDITKKKVL